MLIKIFYTNCVIQKEHKIKNIYCQQMKIFLWECEIHRLLVEYSYQPKEGNGRV